MARCALCGKIGTSLASVDDAKLHHDEEGQLVAYADNGKPIMVTCYTAWTVYDKRPAKPKRAPKY